VEKRALDGGVELRRQGWAMLAGRALDVEKLEITAVTLGVAQAAIEGAAERVVSRCIS